MKNSVIANALNTINQFEFELEYYDSANQINPEIADYYYVKADNLENMNRFEEALEYYDSAIQKNPEKADYFIGKGICKTKILSQYFIPIKKF
ncbi:unnamed protein product [Paramecium pentaurelia]|uniref:Photosystem I assembly protein Ycf3 n=1 Tax=Paramecium pentaurelia TaxID=43138 RepID=A0A8S1XPZ0_9CILI|nr:unnamed protein product [Paramecium pentaurelia]